MAQARRYIALSGRTSASTGSDFDGVSQGVSSSDWIRFGAGSAGVIILSHMFEWLLDADIMDCVYLYILYYLHCCFLYRVPNALHFILDLLLCY